MRPGDAETAKQLRDKLSLFEENNQPLPGIDEEQFRDVFIEQLVESIRRVKYIAVLRDQDHDQRCMDPGSQLFDPLKAAILHHRLGNVEEAFWLTFLFTHFGRHPVAGWRYLSEVYGRLGECPFWTWENTHRNISEFREWLNSKQAILTRSGSPHGFGNHRKYESLSGYSSNGTGTVVESYIRWIDPPRTHEALVDTYWHSAKNDPHKCFDYLYQSMAAVSRFGRMARFDYLTMLGKLGLAPIEPGIAYIRGSTGPLRGANLLFGGSTTAVMNVATLEQSVVELGATINVRMQVLEDALCNWQKSPYIFKRFRG